jgi:hypothetical protein
MERRGIFFGPLPPVNVLNLCLSFDLHVEASE